jgi:uncharacterized repeat protein (TIGR03803 family)
MRMFRISLVISLVIVAGRGFDANAQSETNLHSFVGSPTDGAFPFAGLVQGSDGNFYGTTGHGGTNTDGMVFRISPGGGETILYSFGIFPTDGVNPSAGLVQGSDGYFYGTTEGGGTYANGTVFRISPSGSYTSLYSFGSQPNDGQNPNPLVQGSDGNFYGTTLGGGTAGDGILFRISPGGSETILYSFVGSPADGAVPFAGLVQAIDGNFYGTTYLGGTNDVVFGGDGTVFRISPSGNYTNLYSFGSSPTDGENPFAALVQGSDGNLYGTTDAGGGGGMNGTVFRISTSGSYTSLYSFGSQPNDGQNPNALVQGSDGNLYGTASLGGTSTNCGNGCGIVFRISPSGMLTNLHSLSGYPNDGANPKGGLVQGSDGNFYGTTEAGGATTNSNPYSSGQYGYGTVFKLSVPLNPPANQIAQINSMGTNIVVTIPSVAGETYQLQFTSSLTPTNWVNVPGVSVTNSIGALLTLTNFGAAVGPQGFYRFHVTTGGGSSSSIAQINSIQAVGINMVITITAIPADTYQLQYSTTVSSPTWINIGNPTNNVTGPLQPIDPGGALVPARFYQVSITF